MYNERTRRLIFDFKRIMATNIEILNKDESSAEVAQQIKVPGAIVESSGKVTIDVMAWELDREESNNSPYGVTATQVSAGLVLSIYTS